MKTLIATWALAGLILYGCESKEEDVANIPKLFPKLEVDVNDDSQADLMIDYKWFTWDGMGRYGDGVTGNIAPLNLNSLLRNSNGEPLFVNFGDTIDISAKGTLYWERFARLGVVSISTSSLNDLDWPSEWSIQSTSPQSSYYVGVLINGEDTQLVGWVKLAINRTSGKIDVVDYQVSPLGFVVVDR